MQAKWIKTEQNFGEMCPEFCKTHTLKGQIVKATAKITALGVYNFYINGNKVGDGILAPGWTSYGTRVQAQTYDITALVTAQTAFALRLGNGWAVGYMGYGHWNKIFADNISAWAEITLEYADGTSERVVTDESWQVYTTPILMSEMYHGETVDRNTPIRCVGNALLDTADHPQIVDLQGEEITEHERIPAYEYIVTPKGEKVLDFGQNLAGYVEVTVAGKKGDKIVLSHAEVLDKDGNFYNENLRSARNLCTYILSGDGEETFKPSFSFQGFRYIRLDEFPEGVEIKPENFTAIVIYSDMKRIGDFSCGNEKINQLYNNIIWGQRGNFIDVPTDCPQRDERLGWTGDAQVFCRTAALNYDVEKFFEKWLADMRIEQRPDGGVYGVVPLVQKNGHICGDRIATGWADAAVICPWEIYRAYGNKELLRQNFEMMKKWVGYMHAYGEEEYLFVGSWHYGDWLATDAGYGICEGATQTDLIASAYFAFSTGMVVKVGKILGEDVGEYEELYRKVRAAFRQAFMKDGMPTLYPKADALSTSRPVKGLTQTAIVLVLRFGLYEENERQALIDKLVEMIAENGGRMTTGFLGTPNILHALSENGRTDVAYDLLFQEKAPSWLFSVNHGATTIWEHWDSIREDGTFWSKGMNSFNHYAYGSVYDWIFGVALGVNVDDDGAGYEKITVTPHPDRRLGFAKGFTETRRGKVQVYWRYWGHRVRYEITVPAGTSAKICLPGKEPVFFTDGTYVSIV